MKKIVLIIFIIIVVVVSISVSLVFGFLAVWVAFGIYGGRIKLPESISSRQKIIVQDEAVVKAVKDVSPAVVSIIATKDLPVIEQQSQIINRTLHGTKSHLPAANGKFLLHGRR